MGRRITCCNIGIDESLVHGLSTGDDEAIVNAVKQLHYPHDRVAARLGHDEHAPRRVPQFESNGPTDVVPAPPTVSGLPAVR
jgi:hypothetical protein